MRDTLEFLLYRWLDIERLTERPRFAEHERETFDAVLETCERIAAERFAPFNRLADTQEPHFDGSRVILPEATQHAWDAYAASGMLSASQDAAWGGMQLPYTVETAANLFFSAASVGIGGALLTVGNANLLLTFGTETQKRVFAAPALAGRFSGTMCLSEPQAGSSLSDITTRALPDGPDHADDPLGARYRLRGNKMWISGGEHDLTENIIHLVLAKIPGPDGQLVPGTRGISLFIVPRWLVDTQAQLTGERNDVALAGLNHKLGWRGLPNTLLNFGEGRHPVRPPGLDAAGAGAIGYRVGKPGEGLKAMFHMMNEARIAVGAAATALGLAGYQASLDYARVRLQGRPLGAAGRDPTQPPVRLIEHADVRRMLLAQKSYAQGALALLLYCARLVDKARTGKASDAQEAKALLELLTPIAKSWPSEFCLEANSLAIQVHGGYGYTRDFPVEQYWRDNRLNMIHEGTHGIQALDLLGRKVRLDEGRTLALLAGRIRATLAATAQRPDLTDSARRVQQALEAVERATQLTQVQPMRPAGSGGGSGTDSGASSAAGTGTGAASAPEALANAVPYLQAFGHLVIGWIWLDVARVIKAESPEPRDQGWLAAARYFHRYELPRVEAWLSVVIAQDQTCVEIPEAGF